VQLPAAVTAIYLSVTAIYLSVTAIRLKLIIFLCILLLWIPSATIDTNTGLLRPARSPHHDSPELFYDLRRHPNLRCTATLTCATPPHPTGTLTCVRRHPTCAATSNLRTATPTPHPNLHTATLTVREPD